MALIEIDPNVRVAHNHTYTYLDDTAGLKAGDAHVAHEPESDVIWPASIVSVDHASGFVVLDVAWRKGRLWPKGRSR